MMNDDDYRGESTISVWVLGTGCKPFRGARGSSGWRVRTAGAGVRLRSLVAASDFLMPRGLYATRERICLVFMKILQVSDDLHV